MRQTKRQQRDALYHEWNSLPEPYSAPGYGLLARIELVDGNTVAAAALARKAASVAPINPDCCRDCGRLMTKLEFVLCDDCSNVRSKDPEDQDVYRYTPVKPVKTCRWIEDGEFWHIGCDKTHDGPHQIEAHNYCPYCGGKIRKQ